MKILPYLLLEIVLPDGTLLALALYLYRNRKSFSGPMSIRRAAVRLLGMKPKLVAKFGDC